MVDTSRAKKFGSMLSVAGNVPSPAAPILKGIGYAFKALAFIGDIRNARENATQKSYQEYIKEYMSKRQKQILKFANENKRKLMIGIGLAGLVSLILLKLNKNRKEKSA